MIDRKTIRQGLSLTLGETDFPALGRRIAGKVRDSYLVGDQRTIIVSDRISAFDVVLGTIPFKGQVLSGIAAYWFDATAAVAPNHLIDVPDPAVSRVHQCDVFPIEMIVRAYLTGSSPTSILTHYARGERDYCGHRLPDGLAPHQALDEPLITPTTKAEVGAHDELTTREALIESAVVSAADYDQMAQMCLTLFAAGSEIAASRGLILVDTKYELGRKKDGTIVFVDEIHTPDSSRYWYREGYQAALARGEAPRPLDKDFLRKRLSADGFAGEGPAPALGDELRVDVAERYIELYELLTGAEFSPDLSPPVARICRNLGLTAAAAPPRR